MILKFKAGSIKMPRNFTAGTGDLTLILGIRLSLRYSLSLKILRFFQTKMETVQVFIKSEDDELEEINAAQDTNPLKEETLFLEPLKSER
jgi:hypothetical protein